MTERPILFSGPMVRAILEGRKAQTRRIVKPQPEVYFNGNLMANTFEWKDRINTLAQAGPERLVRFCPYGKPGDKLWVREACYVESTGTANGYGRYILYRATDQDAPVSKWTPSIHMPRWASRITLEVESVRVERLHEISEQDAKAEGIVSSRVGSGDARTGLQTVYGLGGENDYAPTAVSAYADLWQSINGPGSWDANPWVWVVEFKVIRP